MVESALNTQLPMSDDHFLSAPSHPVKGADVFYSSTLLWLQGLHCPGCIKTIEQEITRLDFVESVSASFEHGAAVVKYVDASKNLERIVKRFEEIGYKAHASDLESQIVNHDNTLKQQYISLFAGFFLTMWSMLSAFITYIYSEAELGSTLNWGLTWASGVFALPVVFFSGRHIHKMAYYALKRSRFSIDLLISSASLSAVFISIVIMLGGECRAYYDTAAMLILLLLLGKVIELQFRKKTLLSLLNRLNANKTKVTKINTSGRCIEIEESDIRKQDLLVISGASRIPVEGVLLSRECLVDESAITGEFQPKVKYKGDPISMGSRVVGGNITISAQKDWNESYLNSEIKNILITQSQRNSLTSIMDRYSQYISWSILLVSVLSGVFVLLVSHDWWQAFERLLSVSIIVCPCAIALAAPLSLMKANQLANEKNIAINNAGAVVKFSQATDVIFDKTGTLTLGKPEVVKIHKYQDINDKHLFEMLCQVSKGSSHPISQAIVSNFFLGDFGTKGKCAKGKYTEKLGQGISWVSEEAQEFLLGSKAYLEAQGVVIDKTQSEMGTYFAKDKQLLAFVATRDKLDSEAGSVVEFFKMKGIRAHLLSGDKKTVVKEAAKQLGIKEKNILSECSPEEKAQYIDNLKRSERVVLFVGDGANDNLALAAATVGITKHNSQTLTQQSADVVLSKQGLKSLYRLFSLSEQSRLILKQNLVMAVIYNAAAIPLAVGGVVSPLVAIIAMSLSTLSLTVNTLRKR